MQNHLGPVGLGNKIRGAVSQGGYLIGITQSKSMLCSTAIASASFFGMYFGLHPVLGNHALWLAFILYLVLRGIVLFVIYHKKLR